MFEKKEQPQQIREMAETLKTLEVENIYLCAKYEKPKKNWHQKENRKLTHDAKFLPKGNHHFQVSQAYDVTPAGKWKKSQNRESSVVRAMNRESSHS